MVRFSCVLLWMVCTDLAYNLRKQKNIYLSTLVVFAGSIMVWRGSLTSGQGEPPLQFRPTFLFYYYYFIIYFYFLVKHRLQFRMIGDAGPFPAGWVPLSESCGAPRCSFIIISRLEVAGNTLRCRQQQSGPISTLHHNGPRAACVAPRSLLNRR